MMLIFAIFSVFLASFIKGITAFGFNIIAASSLLFVLSPKVIVPVVTLISAVSSLFLLFSLIKQVEVRRILPLMLGAFFGIPVGVYGLISMPAEVIKILMGALITFFALLFSVGFRKEIKNETPALVLLGLVSGLLGGSTSLGGPPIILFLINQECEKISFRANLSLFYTLQSTIIFVGYLKGGVITQEVVRYCLWLIIPSLLGITFGMKLVHHVNERLFRYLALIILFLSGITAIFSGTKSLFS